MLGRYVPTRHLLTCDCNGADTEQSGAAAWTTARRQSFANDLTNPQLLAVTDNVNQAKGDKGPEDWKPPLSKYPLSKMKMKYSATNKI